MHNFVDSTPLVRVFGLTADHTERFENVNNVVDSSAFNSKLSCALVKQQEVFIGFAVDAQEAAA